MKRGLLYATTNPGKIDEVGSFLGSYGIEIKSPKQLNLERDIEETGKTLEENAKIKLEAYRQVAPEMLIMTDDTGVEIDALGGEPGIHVRRWKDRKIRMTDEEIIKYCLERMKGVPWGKRTARFRTVIALGIPSGETEFFDGKLEGVILEKPSEFRMKGFPFESLFFVPEWKMLLGEAHRVQGEIGRQLMSHRQRAINKAVERIKDLVKTTS